MRHPTMSAFFMDGILTNQCALYLRKLISTAFQFYLISDVCIKDLAYDDMYTPLKEAVSVLSHFTNVTSIP